MVEKQELWHSAQQLKGSDPNFIYKGQKELNPVNDKEEREEVLAKINDVFLHSTGIISMNYGIVIYYKISQENKRTVNSFIVKSVPKELDGWDRLSSILSYGKFPNKQPSVEHDKLNDFFNVVGTEIQNFATSINRTINKDVKDEIIKGLVTAMTEISKKKYFHTTVRTALFYLLFLVLLEMLLIGGGILIQRQIPELFQQEIIQQIPNIQTQNMVQVINIPIQKILQKLVMKIILLMMVNNAVLLILVILAQFLNQRKNR